MEQAQVFFQDVHQNAGLPVLFMVVAVLKVKLCRLHVPVAELVPEVFHKRAGRVVVAVAFKRRARKPGRVVQARVNPLVKLCQIRVGDGNQIAAFQVSQKVAARVPNLVAKAASKLKGIFVNQNVLALRAHKAQSEL